MSWVVVFSFCCRNEVIRTCVGHEVCLWHRFVMSLSICLSFSSNLPFNSLVLCSLRKGRRAEEENSENKWSHLIRSFWSWSKASCFALRPRDEPSLRRWGSPVPWSGLPTPRAADHAVWAGSPAGGPTALLMSVPQGAGVRGSGPPLPGGPAAEQAVRACVWPGQAEGPRRRLLPALCVGDHRPGAGRAPWRPGPPSSSGRAP